METRYESECEVKTGSCSEVAVQTPRHVPRHKCQSAQREAMGDILPCIFLLIPAQNPFFPSIFSAKYSPRTEACRDMPQVTRALRCVHVPTQECRHVPVKVAVDVLQQECHKVRIKIKEYTYTYI